MAIQNQGWAYVSGSGAGAAGGSNTEIQFNDVGALGGSSDLTWDGSTVATTDISASINISASAFYGDGSNLTGITASAVNVADGPEQAIQFRVDTPVSGEISGSSALMFLTASNTLSGTYAAFTAVTASTIVGGSPLTISSSTTQVYGPMQVQSGDSLSFDGATNTFKITNNGTNLDINGANIILNATSVSASTGLSASAFYFGAGGRQQISDTGTDMSILAASTGMFISADGGNLTLQGQVAIDTAGVLSSSVNISASAFYGDGSGLTNLPGGGGGGGIFTELDSSNAYTTSSLSVGTSDAPGATLHVSSSGDEALFRVDGLTATEPLLFVTGSGIVGIGTSTPSLAASLDTKLDIYGHLRVGKSGTGYIFANNDNDTAIKFGGSGVPGNDGISFICGNKTMLILDENAAAADSIILGSASADNIIVSGSLIVSGSISGSGDVNVGGTLNALNSAAMLWGGLDLNSVGITATGPIADATTVSGTYAQFTAVTASAIVGGSPLSISSSATTVTGSLAVSDLDEGGILFAGTDGALNTDVDSLQWTTDREDNGGFIALYVSSSDSGSAALGDGMFMMTDAADEDICFIDAEGAEFAVSIDASGVSAHFGGLNFEGNKVLTSNDGTIMFGATADQDLRANSLFLSGGLDVRGAQQISFGTKLTGYANTIAPPFYRVYPVDTAALTGSTLVTLPAITAATHGLELTIKDIGNNAATYAINVTGATGTGDRIDSSATYKAIATNSGWSTIVAQSGSSGTHVWYQIAGREW